MSDLYQEVLGIVSEQRSVDWHKVRLGRFTASEMFKLMSEPKSKEAKERGDLSDGAKTYVLQKVAERLTGQASTQPFTTAISWGEDYEGEARGVYQELTGRTVDKVNFVIYGDSAGGSPDGNVDEDGQVEIKCPFESSNHILHHTFKTAEDLKNNCNKYWYQMQSNLLFSRRAWCDFISYDPRFKEKYKMKILRIEGDPKAFEQIVKKLTKAEEYRNEVIAKLKAA